VQEEEGEAVPRRRESRPTQRPPHPRSSPNEETARHTQPPIGARAAPFLAVFAENAQPSPWNLPRPIPSLGAGTRHLLDQRFVSFVVGAAVGGSVAALIARARTKRALREKERLLTEKEELLTDVDRLRREADDLRAQAEQEREGKERLTAELSEARARIADFGRLEADLRQRLGRVSGLQPDRSVDY
jgi:hypothetical protein